MSHNIFSEERTKRNIVDLIKDKNYRELTVYFLNERSVRFPTAPLDVTAEEQSMCHSLFMKSIEVQSNLKLFLFGDASRASFIGSRRYILQSSGDKYHVSVPAMILGPTETLPEIKQELLKTGLMPYVTIC